MYKSLLAVAMLVLLVTPLQSFGAVTGQCANCHTMHNSQNGGTVNVPAGPEDGGTYGTLLKNGCVGCHSGGTPTYELGTSTVPVVNHTGTSAPDDYLAGGNFYWVGTGDDDKGHNVVGIAGVDSNLAMAPGNAASCANSCHTSLAVAPSGGNTGPGGCQGCHLAPAHHSDDSGPIVGEVGGYYRFLSGHMSGSGHGVEGIEDDDWQNTVSAGDHNEYFGHANAANLDGAGAMYNMGNTMSGYCCGCHGNFHNENTDANGAGAWIRHPSDVALPSDGEYTGYTIYDPNVPVARPDQTGWTVASAVVTPGTDLVMCLSCHRPHGSPYADLLRWDYGAMDAGTTVVGDAGTGCFVCHTNKDG